MLADLQKQFARHIQNQQQDSEKDTQTIYQSCLGDKQDEEEKQKVKARLSVYQNNFYVSLIDCLRDTYPTIAALCGEDFFKNLAREFIRSHPPQSPLLFEYGETLPKYISECPALEDHAYMTDVAKLEWIRHQSYYAADEIPLDPDSFQKINPTQFGAARVTLHSSVNIISSSFPVYSIWKHNQEQNEEEIDATQAECALVFRTIAGVQTLNIDESFATFIAGLKIQLSISDSLSHAMQTNENFDTSEAVSFLVSQRLCTELLNS